MAAEDERHAEDAVFGWGGGAFAEYTCTSESALAVKPGDVTFEQEASVPVAATTALQGLRDRGKIRPGRKVLVNGASGASARSPCSSPNHSARK